MNLYEVTIRPSGRNLEKYEYSIVAESLEASIERVKTEIPNDFGNEYRYEIVAVKEVARAVVLPKLNQRAKGLTSVG